jgi:predicted transcriptional regulator
LEELAEFLFILANRDRLTLLSEIRNERLRLSQLTAKISATPQETSKHLMRLRDAKLIEKDSDSFFGLTLFGETILKLVPSIHFMTQNREYFLSHDIASLPAEFIERIGELQQSRYVDKVGAVLAHTQRVVKDAEEYIWLMADHLLGNQNYVINSGKLESSSVTWKIIVPHGSRDDWANLRKSVGANKGRIEYRLMEDPKDIKLGTALNERLAGVVFPDSTGRLDFNSGFNGTDPVFCKWCRDLFLFHWNKAGRSVQL